MAGGPREGRRILVTGATGFLGGATARRLASEGPDVAGLGRNQAAGEALEADGIEFLRVDLADRAAVLNACADREAVIHCAALSSPWGPDEAFLEANVVGTEHVVTGCERHGVRRLVHVSTPSLYMADRDRRDIREDEPLPPPINAYARTKGQAEQVVDAAVARGLEAVTIRPRAIFGPGDTVIFPRLIRALEAGRLPVVGSGDNVVNLAYVGNVVDALLAALDAPPEAVGRKYNIANPEPVRLWDLVRRVARELDLPQPKGRLPFWAADRVAQALEWTHRHLLGGREPILTRYSVAVLARSMTLDTSAARRDLGWTPRVGVDEGIEHFLAWWREEES